MPHDMLPSTSLVPVPPTAADIMARLDKPGVNLLPAFLQRYDRANTRLSYEHDLIDFFQTPQVDLPLAQQVTFLHINSYITGLEQSGLKASTLKRRVAAIRSFFDWLEALQLLNHNPAKRPLLRRIQGVSRDSTIIFLTAKQAARLIEATEEAGAAAPRDRALLLTLLHCVLRRAEAAAMDVAHVRPLGLYWVLDLPRTKGGAAQYVKMPAHVVEEIEAMRTHYGITAGPLWRSMSNNSLGKRLSAHSIYCIVRNTARRAGLPEIGAHTLRHTGCTLAIEAGASLQQVQAHARHKQIETTMVYIHQRDRLRDSAADYIRID
jgi:site-specific recombinase XerD